MTPQEQRIAIAEACGWVREWADLLTWNASLNDHKGEYEPVCTLLFRRMEKCFLAESLPDYPSDLNAMHEAELTLSPEQRREYLRILAGVTLASDCLEQAVFATAAHRAEAFLRVKGKLKQD